MSSGSSLSFFNAGRLCQSRAYMHINMYEAYIIIYIIVLGYNSTIKYNSYFTSSCMLLISCSNEIVQLRNSRMLCRLNKILHYHILASSHSFIHFGHFYSAPTTQRRSRLQHGYCIGVSRRSAQATAGKELAQGPCVAARAGVEPTTLRLKVIVSTKAPPRPSQLKFFKSVNDFVQETLV